MFERLQKNYLQKKWNKIRNSLMDYYMLGASVISILGGSAMIIYTITLGVSFLKPFWVYLSLILLGLVGFRQYRLERM